MQDQASKIISALDACSPAAYDSEGVIGYVYLPTEQIGVIVSQALSMRKEIAQLEARVTDLVERTHNAPARQPE